MSKRETYSIRLDPAIMKSIKLTAVNQECSISGIIETALKKYLEV